MSSWRMPKNKRKQKTFSALFGSILKSIFLSSNWICLITSNTHFCEDVFFIITRSISFVTWSRGMSGMLGILILNYWLKELTNSYALFLNCKELSISLQPDVRLRCCLDSKCSVLNGKWFILKIKITYCQHVTHSPWSCHICVISMWNFGVITSD